MIPDGVPMVESGTTLGWYRLEKSYAGDLTGVATGEMLSAVSGTPGSAGYVAIERVTGTLAGRRGSFVLQHSGLMDQGGQSLTISIVPDSGSDGLTGLKGTLRIFIDGKQHAYELDYQLPDGPWLLDTSI